MFVPVSLDDFTQRLHFLLAFVLTLTALASTEQNFQNMSTIHSLLHLLPGELCKVSSKSGSVLEGDGKVPPSWTSFPSAGREER